MRKFILVCLLFSGFTLISCESMRNNVELLGKANTGSCFEVSVYSGGILVEKFLTIYPNSESSSDGWFFKDAITGQFVRVSGTVVIKEVNENLCK